MRTAVIDLRWLILTGILTYVFLLPVRLFSSSDSILAISFIPGNWLTRGEWTHFPSFENFWISKNIYLLFAEFSVRTVNYGSSFFSVESMKKTRIRNLQYRPKKTRLIRCLLLASSCLGDQKQVQDARFDSHLTGVKKKSFYWRTKTIAHNKGFPRK